MPISIAITDDHPMAIAGIQKMLASYSHIAITNTYNTGGELLKGLETEQPDVLLLDILLPDANGPELALTVHRKYPHVNILAITSLDAPIHIKAMFRSGCIGYLLKNTDIKTLIHAIEEVSKGKTYIEPSIMEQMLQNMIHSPKQVDTNNPSLTRRETEILNLISEGNTNQEVADKLFLSLRTIENHRLSLLQKLNVKNAAGLVKKAIQLGLIQ